MEKKQIKPLKEKLLEAINTVLKNNKSELSQTIEKIVKKSIKKIVKRSDKQIKKLPKGK
ncbi:MAG: hypothetical protein NTW54_03815 [Bacteroidetes bacterium]|nr:hypothetical protein [Bacteroidota bacterium]